MMFTNFALDTLLVDSRPKEESGGLDLHILEADL